MIDIPISKWYNLFEIQPKKRRRWWNKEYHKEKVVHIALSIQNWLNKSIYFSNNQLEVQDNIKVWQKLIGSECHSPLQINTTYRIMQPRSSHKDVDDYLISNKGILFACKKTN